jgi:sentrin-specific protease 1
MAGNADIFSKPLLLMPVCINNHWALVAVNHQRPSIAYLDSMGNSGRKEAVLVRDFLRHIAQHLGKSVNVDQYKIESRMRGLPQQTNGYDCGVFMLVFADCLVRGVRMTFTQQDILSYRARILFELLSKKLCKR